MPLDSMDRRSSVRSPTVVRGCCGFVSISSIEIQRPRDPPNRAERDSTKWESCSIRASTGNPLLLDTGQHLLRERVILRRPARPGRAGEGGFAVRRALFQAHALGDRGLEDPGSEDRRDLLLDVLTDHGAP